MKRLLVRLLAVASLGLALVVGVGAFGGSSLLSAAVAATPAGMATVTVVHGIPNLPVDVYVDGKVALSNFQPETVSAPLSLPAGTYRLSLRKVGASPTSTPILSASATLTAGENVSVVAYLSASGNPELTIFQNNLAAIPAEHGRLVVRHTAAAPAVAILANGATVASGLTNGNQVSLTLPVGTISAAVALSGTTTPVIGPANVTIANGVETIVYAVGSAADHNLALVTQTISGLGAMPTQVVTGKGSAFSDHVLPTDALVGLLVLAAGLAGGSLWYLRRARAGAR